MSEPTNPQRNPVRKIRWDHLRRFVQIVVLLALIALIISPAGADGTRPPRELFSQLDPLVGIATIIASRSLLVFGAASVLTLTVTAVFGRVWCGWFCPVGTLVDLVPARRKGLPTRVIERLRFGKYLTLAIVLGSALAGTLFPMILDPITIVTRPMQELAMPFLGNDAVGRGAGSYISQAGLGMVAVLSLLPLAIVLGLNALGRRTFCRTLCPLGGLLALVSKLPGVRRVVDAEACTSCARCAQSCPTAAIDRTDGFASNASECTACMRCVDRCPSSATSFRPPVARPAVRLAGPSRREALATVVATGAAVGAAFVVPSPQAEAEILRPLSTSEQRLAELCVRCGACYSACPTGSLHPSLSLVSKAGLWTPKVDFPRPVHCTRNCNLCAKVCPTDALHVFTPEEAAEYDLGQVAHVTKSRCFAWRGQECFKCAPACPIPGALIDYTERPGSPVYGEQIRLPWVDAKKCVGCNLCRDACPSRPMRAIGTTV